MVYCISDIHGEYELFCELLKKIDLCARDTLIVLGDIIDKGKSSVTLIKMISSMPNAKVILGNHEYDFLTYYRDLCHSDDVDFDDVLTKLRARFPYDGKLLEWKDVDWLERLPAYWECENFVCVHAGVPLDEDRRILPLKTVSEKYFVYDRRFKDPNCLPINEKCVIYGHTPTCYINDNGGIIVYCRNGKKVISGISDIAKIHIDTGAYLTGTLGCFCVDNCTAYYASKA